MMAFSSTSILNTLPRLSPMSWKSASSWFLRFRKIVFANITNVTMMTINRTEPTIKPVDIIVPEDNSSAALSSFDMRTKEKYRATLKMSAKIYNP